MHDAVDAVTTLVEDTHLHAARKPTGVIAKLPPLAPGAQLVGAAHTGIAQIAYATVRTVNRGIEKAGDAALAAVERSGLPQTLTDSLPPLIDEAQAKELAVWADTAQSALNAWVGDHLEERGNNLAFTMGFRRDGKTVPLTREALAEACPDATPKLCVFIHGLGCTDATWGFRALEQFGDPDAHYGTFLERDLGFTYLHVRYNTGRHISDNGHELARLMQDLLEVYPVPVSQIALVGHSMGGLVARSAAHYADAHQFSWVKRLSHLLCIGSPNLGAPLEKATSMLASLFSRIDTAATQVQAKLLNMRSVGIKDLRYGYVVHHDWHGQDPNDFFDQRGDLEPVDWVNYGYVAALFMRDPEHPLGHLLGDLLVRVPSASGKAPEESRHVPFHIGKVVHGVHHIAMLNHPDVYEQVLHFLSGQWRYDARLLPAGSSPGHPGEA